jgi:hypothetical protein
MTDEKKNDALVVSTPAAAQALARRIAGGAPPNEATFWCMTCGFNGKYPRGMTLQFDDDEMAGLGGDPYKWADHQPCPECDSMTLVPWDALGDKSFTIKGAAKESRQQEYREQAEVQAEVFGKKIAEVMVGSVLDGGMKDPTDQTDDERENYPDASEVDTSDLKAR